MRVVTWGVGRVDIQMAPAFGDGSGGVQIFSNSSNMQTVLKIFDIGILDFTSPKFQGYKLA